MLGRLAAPRHGESAMLRAGVEANSIANFMPFLVKELGVFSSQVFEVVIDIGLLLHPLLDNLAALAIHHALVTGLLQAGPGVLVGLLSRMC